jgi:hypothetical protein
LTESPKRYLDFSIRFGRLMMGYADGFQFRRSALGAGGDRSCRWHRAILFVVGIALVFWTTVAVAQDGKEADHWYSPRFSDIVALIGIGVAAVTFGNALWQAKQAQTWKRKEFMAAQMAAFMADAAVQQTLKILDYSARRLNLSDDENERALRGVRVDQQLAAAALIPHTFGREKFTRVEVAIRDGFDVFLERVDKFHDMLKVKLLKLEDITPYLNYWLESIADTDGFLNPNLKRSLWLFIDVYEYHGIQELCRKIGYPISPRAEDIAGLKEEIARGEWGATKDTGQKNPPLEDDAEESARPHT